jgi:hypothetical protein
MARLLQASISLAIQVRAMSLSFGGVSRKCVARGSGAYVRFGPAAAL